MIQRKSTVLVAAILAWAGVAGLSAQGVDHEVIVSQLDNEKFLPSVAYNGEREEFLIVWHNLWPGSRDVNAARVDRFGRVISSFNVTTGANDRAQPAVAYDPVRDRYLIVWIYDYYGDGSDWDVYGRLVPWYGPDPALTEFPIYSATDSQWNPKVAYSTGDDEFLVAWGNTSASALASISLGYVAADGNPYYAVTLAGDASHNYLNPAITYNQLRNEYLVAYEIDQVDIAARRVNYLGPVGSQVIVAAWPDAEVDPAVAACPGQDQWLVAWQNSAPDVYARFLFGDGSVDGAPLLVPTYPPPNDAPAVACLPGGARYLVTWEEDYSGGVSGIIGRALGANKVFLTPELEVRPVFAGQLRDAKTPAVAGGSLGWSVAWVQEREGSTYSDIHAAMVWAVFADDFETGNTAMWPVVVP